MWSGATKKVTKRAAAAGGPGRRVGGCAPRVSRAAQGSARRCSRALRAPPRPRFPTCVSVAFPLPWRTSGQKALPGQRAGLPPASAVGEFGLPVGQQLAPASIGRASLNTAAFLVSEKLGGAALGFTRH